MPTRFLTATNRTRLETSSAESSHPQNDRSPGVAASRSVDTSAGFLLADESLKPIYANDAAVLILNYARPGTPSQPAPILQERLRTIYDDERVAVESSATTFLSGRRRYTCRRFLLESRSGHLQPPMIALLLERSAREAFDLSEASRRYHLSRRECETVQHLMHGLTTKEIAECMTVSPNTVKQFIRLVMTKMGVTTRSGIVGKLLGG